MGEINRLLARYFAYCFNENRDLKSSGAAQTKAAFEFYMPHVQGQLTPSELFVR